MADAHVSHMPGRPGRVPSSSARAAQVARRRRCFLWTAGLLVAAIAVLANYGPISAYYDAKARLDKASQAVVELEAQKSRLQAELGRLSEADYLESLARQDLAYTRPGEELYIVTGMDSAGTSSLSTGLDGLGADSGPGFLERILGPSYDSR